MAMLKTVILGDGYYESSDEDVDYFNRVDAYYGYYSDGTYCCCNDNDGNLMVVIIVLMMKGMVTIVIAMMMMIVMVALDNIGYYDSDDV